MKTFIRQATLLGCGLALALSSVSVTRGQDTRFYTHVDLGGSIPHDINLNEFFSPVPGGSKVTLDPGFRVGLAGGYRVTDWFATEIEFGGMANNIKSITGAVIVDDASFSNIPIMFNVKLQLPNRTRLVPYIGGGAGVSFSIIDADYILMNVPTGQIGFSGTDSTAVFAWQALAGVRFDLNERMGLCVEYRFFWADNASFSFDNFSGFFPPPGNSISLGHSQLQTISLAFEYRF